MQGNGGGSRWCIRLGANGNIKIVVCGMGGLGQREKEGKSKKEERRVVGEYVKRDRERRREKRKEQKCQAWYWLAR